MQTLGWGFPVERSSWRAVEFGGNGVEAVAGVDREVGKYGRGRPLVFSFEPRYQGLAGA